MYHKELMGLSHIKEANIKLIAIGRARTNFLLATSEAEREKHPQSIKTQLDGRVGGRWRRRSRSSSRSAPRELFAQIDKTWVAV